MIPSTQMDGRFSVNIGSPGRFFHDNDTMFEYRSSTTPAGNGENKTGDSFSHRPSTIDPALRHVGD